LPKLRQRANCEVHVPALAKFDAELNFAKAQVGASCEIHAQALAKF